MSRLMVLVIVLLASVSLVTAAERLRIVEEDTPKASVPHQTVLLNITGSTPAERKLIDHLWRSHAAAFPPQHRSYAVPDSGGIRIQIESGGNRLEVFSCHVSFERNSGLVATAAGIEALNGRSREEVLRTQPLWFLRFRGAFESIVAEAQSFRASHSEATQRPNQPMQPTASRRAASLSMTNKRSFQITLASVSGG